MLRLLVAGSLLAAASSAVAETRVLENFTLIDGTGKPAVANAAILMVDGRIRYAGPKAGLKAPAGAERVDLAGKFVMPGIMNMHAHLGNTIGLVQDPKNFTPENLKKQLDTYSRAGVTTVISMGSDQPPVFDLRAKQRAGRPTTTRIFTAYKGFTGKGGYPTTAMGMKGVPYEVETKEQVVKDVNELASQKVDLVKIWVDDHLGKERKIPMDLSCAIIENAHKHGLKVAAHIFYLDDAKKLIGCGLDGLAHSVRDKPVDAELINLMKSKGAWQEAATITREMSMFVYAKPDKLLADPLFLSFVDKGVVDTIRTPAYQKKKASLPELEQWRGFAETAKKNLKKLVDSGVKYAFGTDTGPPERFSGYFEHWELDLMAEAGLTPAQIIQSFSKNAAEFLGQSKDLGTIESGHWADLVVLNKNPLDNIHNAREIASVWIAGNKVR
jgi:imidazolonepropionase-like amidohydrolase